MDMFGSFWREATDACEEALPPAIEQAERRMQARAWSHWAGLRGARAFPAPADLDLATIPEIAAQAVWLDVSDAVAPRVLWLGAGLTAGGLVPTTLTEAPAGSLLAEIDARWRQMLVNAAPIGFEAETSSAGGGRVLHRAILLPFADADGEISHVLAVANGREVAPLAVSDDVLRELGGALAELAPEPATDFAERLATARRAAAEATATSGSAGRQRLYDAIGAAWDLALAADADPAAFATALGPAGIVVRAGPGLHAPLLAVAKLAFGVARDKTRLTEIATVLGHARRLGLPAGMLGAYLRSAPGGLKAVIAEARRGDRPAPEREAVAAGWRTLPGVALADLPGEGPGLTLLAARRGPQGVEIVGEIAGAGEVLRRLGKRAQLRGREG